MKGRTERKLETEKHIRQRINTYPRIILSYYYSLNTSEHTTKLRYISNVLRFVDYMFPERNFDISDICKIERTDVEEYIDSISFYEDGGEMREIKASTKACIFSSLASFFKFMVDNRHMEINPISTIKRPKIQQNDVVYLTPDEVRQIENRILNEGSGNQRAKSKQENWKHRDFLLFHIPVINGIRIEALREINICDMHLENKTITVTEKGNITKNVYIDDTAIHYIQLWLNEREQFLTSESDCDALFISNRKTRITARAIENIIAKYADGINGKHITPHKLRSTFGTNAYNATHDIKAVAQGLGHKSTVPTERYVGGTETRNKTTVGIVADLYR